MCWAPRSVVWWPPSSADPHRLAALGVTGCSVRGEPWVAVRRSAAERLVAAARTALLAPEAVVARQVLADDLGLLAELDGQIAAAEAKIAKLLPDTPFAVLPTVPGWGTIRAGNYGAAVGDPRRWPGARLYRASGLSPAQYESAGKRRDGSISREGSVAVRRALIDLGIGLWRSDPAARRYGQQLRARGKKGGVIGCAMANRANKIAYAMVRDQSDTTQAAGPDRSTGFPRSLPTPSRAAAVNLSARSAARTNEVDRGEQRRTIWRRGSTRKELAWPLPQPCLPMRRWTARRAGHTPM